MNQDFRVTERKRDVLRAIPEREMLVSELSGQWLKRSCAT